LIAEDENDIDPAGAQIDVAAIQTRLKWGGKMWRKLIGVAIVVFGVGLTARGLWQWNEPPRQPSGRYWWASRQMEDMMWGPLSVLIGIPVYRRGWKAFQR
jgi:uncharacterized membrane protein YidH (DUF202 family)